MKTKYSISILFSLFFLQIGLAQRSQFFEKEVQDIQKKYETLWDATKETIVFTGSSSVRLWKDLEQTYTDKQIVNSGFGGSKAYNLLDYLDELVLQYNPKKVFIYEGDNDISDRLKLKRIIKDMNTIIAQILKKDASTEIILISPKPSISRWKLKGKYKRLNKKLRKLSDMNSKLFFANVWDIMLDGKKLKKDLFIEDGLHMNQKGYDLWHEVIANFIN